MPDGPKRKLTLLPEQLPDPTREAGEGSARARTLDHMRQLLAGATVALAGCSPSNQPEKPQPQATVDLGPEQPAPQPVASDDLPDPEPEPKPTESVAIPAPSVTGYMVVDMLPPPPPGSINPRPPIPPKRSP